MNSRSIIFALFFASLLFFVGFLVVKQPRLLSADEYDEYDKSDAYDKSDSYDSYDSYDSSSDEEETEKIENTYIDISNRTSTMILGDGDGDGILDNEDPHPNVAEQFVVSDDDKNGIVDSFEKWNELSIKSN